MAFDFDFYVVGAGSGGVRAARFAAGFGAKVGVAESRYLGGTCVNVGCVPKKLLVYSSHFGEDFERAKGFGWSVDEPQFDWPRLIANKNAEISRLNTIYRNLLVNAGVTLHEGHAKLVDAHTVEINGQRHTAKNILLATGGWPMLPKLPGIEHAISSNEAFFLKELPRRVMVVGGGYIAVEFAGIFNGMGAQTTLSYRGGLFLRGFDQGVREHLRDQMTKSGVKLCFNHHIKSIDKLANGSLLAHLENGETVETDVILYATGRRPMLDNLGIENTKVELDGRGFVKVDEFFQSTEPSIFALGDVIGRVQLTPVATAEGMAVARHLFSKEDFRPVDYKMIPTAVFSQPPIGTVGQTEEEARSAGHKVRLFVSRFKPMSLSLTSIDQQVYMKLIVDADTDKVLGCHMVGADAGEILQGIAVAIKAGATKRVFDDTIGIHPTAAEEFVTMRTAVA